MPNLSSMPHWHWCRTAIAWLALLLTTLAGCSGKSTYPVKGMVVYKDGTAATDLAGYLVSFESSEAKASANGLIQPDGTFQLGTFEEGDGAPPGKYQVTIAQQMPLSDEPIPPSVIDPKYASDATSGLEATIAPQENDIRLEIDRRQR
jgi:hypothetical protein